MAQNLTLIGCPFTGAEIALLIAVAARAEPNAFNSDKIKAVIYKAKAEVAHATGSGS